MICLSSQKKTETAFCESRFQLMKLSVHFLAMKGANVLMDETTKEW